MVNDMHITKNTINDFILNWDEMLEQAKANNVSTVIIGEVKRKSFCDTFS